MALITQARVAATGRTAATDRRLVQNMTNSLSFDGVNDTVSIPDDASFDQNGSATIRAIVRFHKNVPSGTNMRVVSFRGNNAIGIEIYTTTGENKFIGFLGDTISGFKETAGSVVFTPSEWIEVVYVVSASSQKLYINGSLDAATTRAMAGNQNPTGTCYLGSRLGTLKPLAGNIAQAQYWVNRALTAGEIAELYRTGVLPHTSDLALNLQIDEGSGTTVSDTSGNGNDGTISGASWTTDVPSKARVART